MNTKGQAVQASNHTQQSLSPQITPAFPGLTGEVLLTPVWQVASGDDTPWPEPVDIALDEKADAGAISRAVKALASPEHLLWRVGGAGDLALTGLRLIQSLLAEGYGDRPLMFTVITRGAQAVRRQERAEPQQAAVHGLIGALAKEYPHWRIRLLDLPVDQVAEDIPWQTCPADPLGDARVWREGRWYRLRLLPCRPFEPNGEAFRRAGVYVVLGGAGGIGLAFSEYLIRRYQAQMVWLGRRPEDETITAQCERLAALGPRPLYLQADATDREQLELAYQVLKVQFPRINGLVHSAIVLADQTLAVMDEARFSAALQAKCATAHNFDAVFGHEPLDFQLYFSSLQSFTKAPGQANYAAGCCYADAFAHNLGERPYPVKTIHWGYWGSIGVVASPFYREQMAKQGVDSIEPPEAMATLERLLTGPFTWLGLIKTLRDDAFPLLVDRQADWIALAQGSPEVTLPPLSMTAAIQTTQPIIPQLMTLEQHLAVLLHTQLSGLGWLDIRNDIPLPYQRWRSAALMLLDKAGILPDHPVTDLAQAWEAWEHYCRSVQQTPGLSTQIQLAEATMRALPDILTGKKNATEVMFPQGSMKLVEGIYHQHPVSNSFNTLLTDALTAWLEASVQQRPDAHFRILEIGAGTGGTSREIFSRLKPWAARIDEYAYTDVSEAFLRHARTHYAQQMPALVTRRLNIEQSPAGQDFIPASYDIIVATNVLHATSDIRRTLRHCKSLLKRQGLLLINEVSVASLFSHVTFGLLDGWWLFEDSSLRLPGSPVLAAETWRRLLTESGFTGVALPAAELSEAGQQIVTGFSDGIIQLPASQAASGSPKTSAVQDALTPQSSGSAIRAVKRMREMVAEMLNIPPHKINPAVPLGSYGVDSIMALQLSKRLGNIFTDTSATLLFEYPTIEKLANYFAATQQTALERWLDEASGGEASGGEAASPQARPRRIRRRFSSQTATETLLSPPSDGIAVIGISGRYPRAADLTQFWHNLEQGIDCITRVPAQRWGEAFAQQGGFIDDIACFDPLFFHILPREAELMDPQERLFLQCAWHVIEDAGYTPRSLSPQNRVGVFVGVMNNAYSAQPGHWSIANRVSFTLDFRGPSMAVDTACSSSLSAIHLALDSLAKGRIDCAIAGGVNLIADTRQFETLSGLNMLSADNRCRSFGAGAEGFADAEGIGAVLLKPLARAVADGDHIYGVIKGSALNHGGRTGGYTVPNPKAQAEMIGQALHDAGVNPRSVSYIEAHGTGTALGDPIEISGLSEAFGLQTQDKQFCAIGSVKSNIGHCESAAGIAGLTKVLLQMHHGKRVKSLHSEALNPHIDFSRTPFVVQQHNDDWPRPCVTINGITREYPRIAGISSFGAGGANAHLIIEEYTGAAGAETPANDAELIVLSARTQDALLEQVARLHTFAAQHDVNLADLAYTLQTGREAMACRLALLVDSRQQLLLGLQALKDGEVPPQIPVWQGETGSGQDTLEIMMMDNASHAVPEGTGGADKCRWLAGRWIQGGNVDWALLWGETKPKRLSLPGYPFARESYWQPAFLHRANATGKAGEPTGADEMILAAPYWVEQPLQATEPAGDVCLFSCDVSLGEACVRLTAEGSPAQRYTQYAEQLMTHLQERLAQPGGKPLSIALVVDARDGESVAEGLHALLRSVEQEYLHLRCQTLLLDRDALSDADALAALLDAEAAAA
ncbi:SDR family NAD(P)-dependent oxidoreductase, partial [Enterobacillus tribolii]